jgi:3-oxoacyl-[acyl-carrier protein] reductase
LRGKRALVTGGSRGIGAAIAARLAREGADVALTHVSHAEAARRTVQDAQAHGVRALAIRADAADPRAAFEAVERTVAEFGGIEILVNNAGIAPVATIDEFSLEDFDRTIAVNLRAAFLASQAALRHMQSGARIILISSCTAERVPLPGGSLYAMSKAGLIGLVKGMARDLGPRGITANNVLPGPIDTDMNPADNEFAASVRSQILALPRYGTADEVAALVAFLAGPEAGFITGASLSIDGGFTV